MKTDKLKIAVGQTVWVEPSSNCRKNERAIRKSTVSKVGRQYFEVEGELYCKFNIVTGVQHDSSNYKSTVYISEQDLLDKQEFETLSFDVKKCFSGYGQLEYSLDTLRKIKVLLDNDKCI